MKFLRYLLPVTPFLAIMAASLSDKGLTRLRALRPSRNFLYGGGVAGLGLVVFATVFYSFAYANVYTDDHPATRASDYVREQIPPRLRSRYGALGRRACPISIRIAV